MKELHEAFLAEKMQTFMAVAKEAPEGAVTFKMVISSEDTDRMGDVVKVSGWELENYLNNPVVLMFHDYATLPVGITTKLYAKGKNLIAEGYFAPEEANPIAGQAAKLYQLGLLKSSSVGFIPKEFDPNDRSIITRAELLEWSFTPVPANPFALSVMKQAELEVANFKGIMTEENKEVEDEEVETKGEVANEIADVEKREKKYENMRQVWDVMYAFAGVYYSDEKEVDDFSELLKETATILQTISEGGSIEEKKLKVLTKEELEAIQKTLFPEIMSEKAGRVLSEKNQNLIKEVVSGVDSLVGIGETLKGSLSDLLASAETASVEGDEKVTQAQKEAEALLKSQRLLREVATVIQGGLAEVNLQIKKA